MGARIANKLRELHPEHFLTITLGGFRGSKENLNQWTQARIEAMIQTFGIEELNVQSMMALGAETTNWPPTKRPCGTTAFRRWALIGADDSRLPVAQTLQSRMTNIEVKIVPGDHGTASFQPEFTEELVSFLQAHPAP